MRVDVSYTLGKIDCSAYLEPALFHPEFSEKLPNRRGVTRHHEWLGKHARLINESKEEFVRHNKTKYGLPLAIGIALKLLLGPFLAGRALTLGDHGLAVLAPLSGFLKGVGGYTPSVTFSCRPLSR